MNPDNLTFESAFSELEQIVKALEDNTLTIDELSVSLQRASQLISFCRQKLQQTELDVQKILSDLEAVPGVETSEES
ncbi:MAG: exodeoxyribonuclease VII small subunit [Bacteroidetes bacterium]|nr:exodeoxyribonuclease VII small subunit [Bacteroidota bacterium]